MVEISVVIPVYNVEEFLEECLDSIVNQTFRDIEIICIDDGSTDNSSEILNKYQLKDKRIKVFSQENSGHAVATNRGIDIAKGKYLYLMDSDDILELTALEETYNFAEEKNVDFLIFQAKNYAMDENRYYESELYSLDKIYRRMGDKIFNYKDISDLIFEIPVTPWSKLYNTDFIRKSGAKFPEGLVFDDNIFFFEILFNAERIAIYHKYLFIRRWYSYSSTTNGDERFLDSIDINNLTIDLFKKYGLFNQYKSELYNRKVNLGNFRFVRIKNEFKELYFNKLKDDFNVLVNDGLYDDYLNNLNDRNKFIFKSCLESKTTTEFKYKVLYYDSENKVNNLNRKIKDLEDRNQDLRNENKSLEDKNDVLNSNLNNLKIQNSKNKRVLFKNRILRFSDKFKRN